MFLGGGPSKKDLWSTYKFRPSRVFNSFAEEGFLDDDTF